MKGLARPSVESVMIESTSMRSLWRMTTLLAALVVSIWPVCGQMPDTTTNRFNEKTIRQWTLKGPLGNTPKQVREDLPLSDQSNRGGWARFEPMWDEFETMPEWFGMANDNDLPSTYSIEYIRAWTRDETP